MLRSAGLLITFVFLAAVCQPNVAYAIEHVADGFEKGFLVSNDDIAACADEPAPDMNGRNVGLAGKPVNLLSGVEGHTRTDLVIGSVFPISVTRRYDSRAGYDSPLGYGWAINYDRRIYTYPDGSVTLRKECGWKRRFTLSGGSYITPIGETGTLVQNTDGSYTYTYKSGDKDNYDSRGRLKSRSDTKGNSVVIYYELDSRSPLWGLLPANLDQNTSRIVSYDYKLSRIEEKDAAGNFTNRYVLFHYDSGTGRLTDIVDNTGRTVTYNHDGIGNLTSVSGPSGSMSYGYADPISKHRLTSLNEGDGEYVNAYDAKGRVIKQTHGTGIIDFEYLMPYKKTRVTTTIKDSAGNVLNTQTRTTEFGDLGQPSKVTDTFGHVTIYTRDGNARITREEYWENTGTVAAPSLVPKGATNYTHDTKGNKLTETIAQGTTLEKTTTYTYHPTFSKVLTETVKSVVNPAQNRVITNAYDNTNGNLLNTTETGLLGDGTPYSYTMSYEHDANGRIIRIDGPRTDVSDVTTYAYDSTTGYLTTMTQPIIGTTTYSNHDPLGNPQTVTDPNGNATTYTYDTIGRVLTVKAPGDIAATQYYYVSGGCASCGGANKIDHITLPEGNTIWYTYDTMGNLTTIKDGANNTINYTYDSEGNRLTEEIRDSAGSLQKTLSYQYDALNRVKQVRNPDNTYTEYGYDFGGKRASLTDPRGNTTTYTYDALGRMTDVIQPGNIITKYGFDTNNNVTSVKDANNNTTTYKYDDKGRVYQIISPDTGTTTYQYDPAGNLISKTDAKGVTISYVYDALSRLTKIDFPTDTDIVYAYDSCVNGKGRLCSMTDASGTTAYEYTPKGQVKKETKTIDTLPYVTQYTYDQNGNLKTMTYPSGRVITYTLSNDKVTAVLNNAANLATNINYKPFGGMSSITYGNGITGSISVDNQYRVTNITAGAVMNLNYDQYDANANIQHITNTLDPTKNKTLGYDALDRLTSAAGSWGSLSWTYDGIGNRLTEGANSYAYTAGTNKLSSANGLSYGFDNNGNTTAEGARVYTYNQNQRLIRVVDAGVTKGEYTYNGNGQRVKKVVNGVATIFHYNRTGQLIAESDSTGATTAEYVYLNGQPLAKIEGSNAYFYLNDNLGTPLKMTDSTGAVVWAADYKPFGEATITVSTITNNLRFPGQYYDAETGLNYNNRRDYNFINGGFVEADPSGINRGRNHMYRYAGNNPLNAIDPSGLECEQVSPWTPATVISDPNNLGTLIDSYTVKEWGLMGVWNGMPIFAGGKAAKGPCGCTWQKIGYKKISTYIKDVTYQASFKCCTKGVCSEQYCNTETRYKDFSQTYTKTENETSLFGFETTVTTGFYLGDGSCSCANPNF